MNQYICCCFLILLSNSLTCFAKSINKNSNYWECTAHDAANIYWTSQSNYQKIALNYSFAECKKNSKVPTTCIVSNENCAKFIQGVNVIPTWHCTALDRKALPWRSNNYANRVDAALAAEALCKHKSSVPSTCSINLITCINENKF